ncbi:MAG TPA: hypothetical protein VNQ90_10950 [Chthoniobacteraceae bacterium]|nr:hypothetical protein [Chthoniobacteraceae bacterium]
MIRTLFPLFRCGALPRERSGANLHRRSATAGITLIEAVTAMAVTAIISAAAIGSLLTSQTLAARTRLLTNARVLVQRNIDTALVVPFTSTNVPPILTLTSPEGAPFSDDATDSTGESVPVALNSEGDPIVTGTLTRIVTNLNNSEKPSDVAATVIRRVTFRINYTYLDRPYQYEMTTLRAQDEQGS